jgi:hypothetical protein
MQAGLTDRGLAFRDIFGRSAFSTPPDGLLTFPLHHFEIRSPQVSFQLAA